MRAIAGESGLTDGQDDSRLLRAQLRIVIHSLYYTVFFNLPGVAMIYGPVLFEPDHFGAVPISHFWIVLGLQIVCCIASALVYRQRDKDIAPASMTWILSGLQIVLGINWGITVWLLWVEGDSTNNVFCTLVMVSMLWAATVTRAMHMGLYILGLVPMAGLFWLRLATGATVVAHVLAFLFPIWLAYVVRMGLSIRRNVEDMLVSRFNNEKMTAELKQARDEAQYKRREAEETNRSKTAFLANMSHELRTPLNAILGFSDMIANEALGQAIPAQYRDYARDINETGAHLLSLINDLLDIAKIEAGHMEINPRALDLAEMIAMAKRVIEPKITAKRQILTIQVEPGIEEIWVDERAIRQILLNLLSNANKFTPEGGKIELACARTVENGLLITVEDNGIGIPSAKLENIFEPFAQADNRYDRVAGGLGLGLALVRGLTELHGGNAWIESTLGKGTRVFVYFPLVDSWPYSSRQKA